MRTTVLLDDDTAAALQKLRREQGKGVSEAINELIRRRLRPSPATLPRDRVEAERALHG